jgi:hypothetical protein
MLDRKGRVAASAIHFQSRGADGCNLPYAYPAPWAQPQLSSLRALGARSSLYMLVLGTRGSSLGVFTRGLFFPKFHLTGRLSSGFPSSAPLKLPSCRPRLQAERTHSSSIMATTKSSSEGENAVPAEYEKDGHTSVAAQPVEVASIDAKDLPKGYFLKPYFLGTLLASGLSVSGVHLHRRPFSS